MSKVARHGTWVIEPADRCVRLIVEETKNAKLIQNALKAFIHVGPLLRAHYERTPTRDLRDILREHEAFAGWAQEIAATDFHSVNAHGIIGLWVAVEVAIEDTVTLILTRDATAMTHLSNAGFKRLPQVDPGIVLSEERASQLYKSLERQSRGDAQRGDSRSVAEASCHLLSVLGVNVALPSRVAVLLTELNYVRNCLLHRGANADGGAASEAPELNLRPGDPIKLPSERYLRYYEAASAFAQALMKGALEACLPG
jgi:hypothetical protein